MDLTSKNFDTILENQLNKINNWYDVVDNAGLARLNADEQCIKCIKNKGYSYISSKKDEINDCKSNYLNYNNLSWKELINNVFQNEVKIGGKKQEKTRKNNKNKNLRINRKKTNRRLKCKKRCNII